MRFTHKKIYDLWKSRDEILASENNRALARRFDATAALVDELLNLDLQIDRDAGKVFIGGKELLSQTGQPPEVESYFGPAEDEMCKDERFAGVEHMASVYPEYGDLIRRVGCLLGGFDFADYVQRSEYFIISNTITSANDDGALDTGRSSHSSSHFADNNYFFEIAAALKDFRDGKFDAASSRIVLRYPATESKYFLIGNWLILNNPRKRLWNGASHINFSICGRIAKS